MEKCRVCGWVVTAPDDRKICHVCLAWAMKIIADLTIEEDKDA